MVDWLKLYEDHRKVTKSISTGIPPSKIKLFYSSLMSITPNLNNRRVNIQSSNYVLVWQNYFSLRSNVI